MKTIIDKRALAAHYRDNYGINVDLNEIERLTEKQLLIKLETRLQMLKERKAAVLIQSHCRRIICRNRFFWLQAARQAAAKRL